MLSAIALALFPAPADLTIENAMIWSNQLPHPMPFAAVKDGRFVYVGEKDASYQGPNTIKIDAKGADVLPGLIDSHCHLLNAGILLSNLMLRDVKDKAEFVKRVADWDKTLAPGRWVLGGRWSVESWSDKTPPTKEWIDPVTPDRPVYLSRMDGHSALANSVALKLAGITKDTPDPAGGVIDKDAKSGEPTGILRETAMALVTRHIPQLTQDDKLAALKRAIKEINKQGITAVSCVESASDFPVYARMAKDPDLSLRVSLYATATDWEATAKMMKAFEGKPGWIEPKGFKAFMDGSLGSRTAFMRSPFNNNEKGKEDWHGLAMPIVTDGTFLKNAKAAHAAGYQTIAHAIGDEANHVLLEQLSQAYPNLKDARCRSEHSQHLLAEDVPRFGQLGVIASMQPYHKADDGRYAESYIGAERSKSSYAYRSLLAGGAVVSFGSDWPVVTMNPFLGMEAAVTAKTLDGKVWQIQESIPADEALRCYTSRAAYAMFADKEIGEIAAGKRADFVIMNASPFDQKVDWSKLAPTAVYIEGRKIN